MNGALHVDGAGLLEFLLVHLALNGLRDVEEAVVALEKLNVVEYGVAVLQRDLAVDRHDLNMRTVFALALIDLCILGGRRHSLAALHAFDDDDGISQTAGFVHQQLLHYQQKRVRFDWLCQALLCAVLYERDTQLH